MTKHDPQDGIEAARFLDELIVELERKAREMTDETSKLHLIETAKNFRQLFSNNANQLYALLRNCILFDKKLICSPNCDCTEIIQTIEDLKSHVRENRDLTKKLEFFFCDLCDAINNNAQLTSLRLSLVDKFKETLQLTETVQQKVIDRYLNQWRDNRGLAGNDALIIIFIIQGWCEHLADILWNTREQIKTVSENRSSNQLNTGEQNVPDFLPELLGKVTNLLECLIARSFIIEKQPPQVIKTNTR